MDIENLKSLWIQSFGDTRRYADFYFSRRYRPEYTYTASSDGKIVSAAQFFPYTVTAGSRVINGVYILGVCTAPDFRRRGYVDSILNQGIDAVKASGADLVFLIPQEQWLFDFYRRYGFSEMFYAYEEKVSRADFERNDSAIKEGVEIISRGHIAEVYGFYDAFHRNELSSAVLKTRDDFDFAIEELWARDCEAAIYRGHNGAITGFAAYEYEDGSCVLRELLCVEPQARAALVAWAFARYGTDSVTSYSPTVRFTQNAERKALGMGKFLSDMPDTCLDDAYANLLMN